MSLQIPAPADESAGAGGTEPAASPPPDAQPDAQPDPQPEAEARPGARPGAQPAPRPAGRARGRLRALDGLRLVAALMVCAYHYGGRGGDIQHAWGSSPSHLFPHLAGAFSYGPLGVQIFFIISGFVICMSGWGRSVKDFAISRIVRLYPAYWAALVIVTVAFVAVGYQRPSNADLLTNVTMLQMPAGAERVLGVCWTLWAEMRFYLLFTLFVVCPSPFGREAPPGASRKRVLVFCAVWTVGALYADTSGQEFLKTALMPAYAPFFVGGMGLYLVYRFGHDAFAWGVVAVGFLLGQRYAVQDLVAPKHMDVFHHRTQFAVIAVVALGFAAVAAVTLVPWIARVEWRWLTTAGALTYPFYLVHEHLGWVVIGKARAHTGLTPWVIFAGTALSMLVLAWLMHRLVERPLAPLLKRVLSRPVGG